MTGSSPEATGQEGREEPQILRDIRAAAQLIRSMPPPHFEPSHPVYRQLLAVRPGEGRVILAAALNLRERFADLPMPSWVVVHFDKYVPAGQAYVFPHPDDRPI